MQEQGLVEATWACSFPGVIEGVSIHGANAGMHLNLSSRAEIQPEATICWYERWDHVLRYLPWGSHACKIGFLFWARSRPNQTIVIMLGVVRTLINRTLINHIPCHRPNGGPRLQNAYFRYRYGTGLPAGVHARNARAAWYRWLVRRPRGAAGTRKTRGAVRNPRQTRATRPLAHRPYVPIWRVSPWHWRIREFQAS